MCDIFSGGIGIGKENYGRIYFISGVASHEELREEFNLDNGLSEFGKQKTMLPWEWNPEKGFSYEGWDLYSKPSRPLEKLVKDFIATKFPNQNAIDSELEYFINNDCSDMRRACVRYGSDAIREKLLNDKNSDVRRDCAVYGSDVIREKLLKHEDYDVRRTCAVYGSDVIREKLLNDKDSDVRRACAQFGSDVIRKKFEEFERIL